MEPKVMQTQEQFFYLSRKKVVIYFLMYCHLFINCVEVEGDIAWNGIHGIISQ